MQALTHPTMYFIGVTTSGSSMMKIFPLWMAELGRPEVRLEGIDFQLHAAPEAYRVAVRRIKEDPLALGALVTAHKINLFAAARDLFDYLDPDAGICQEVSCVSKNGGRLEGRAVDPLTSGRSLRSLLGEDYFARTGGEVLCLGAGGSATAIALHFIRARPDGGPRRMVIVDRSPGPLERLEAMARGQRSGIEFVYHCHSDPRRNDALMAGMPPGSLVINATGMGKDLPGSPITGAGVFPARGVAWELNYRGELEFLRQALAQRQARSLTVEDGWAYFLYGWTEIVSEVLKVRIGRRMFARLSALAARAAPPLLPPRI